MPTFTVDIQNTQEALDTITDYIGGTFKNYIKTIFPPISVVYVKQSGVEIPYTLEDIDGDGELEIVVGSATESALVKFNYEGGDEPYSQAAEITIYNPTGTPNNYVEVTNYPVTTVNDPATGTIDGIGNQLIRVGGLTGKINVNYQYDAGELGAMAGAAVSKEEEYDELIASIDNLEQTKIDKYNEFVINNKMATFYYQGFDLTVSYPTEYDLYQDEYDNKGSWTWQDQGGGNFTWYYTGGHSTEFAAGIIEEIEYNKKELASMAIQGLQQEEKISLDTLTISTAVSGENFQYGERILEKAIDDQIGIDNAFQSNAINPITIFITLDSLQYITKIRINATPELGLEIIESVKLMDDYGTSGIELLREPKEVANEWIDIDAIQKFTDDFGIAEEDENGQEKIYLAKKKIIGITISRALSDNVWINEIEIYKAAYTPTQLSILESTWNIYNINIIDSQRNYGPDDGWDTIPPTGRATWIDTRFTNTLTNRQSNITTWVELPENIADAAQIVDEGDTNYVISQKKLWREKFDSSETQQFGIQNSISDTGVEIVKIGSELRDYQRYL